MSSRDAERVRGALTSLKQARGLVHPARVATALGLPMRHPRAALMVFALGWIVLFFALQAVLPGTVALVLALLLIVGAVSAVFWRLSKTVLLESPARERLDAELLEAERFLGELGAQGTYGSLQAPLSAFAAGELDRLLPQLIREVEQE